MTIFLPTGERAVARECLVQALEVMEKLREYAGDTRDEFAPFRDAFDVAKRHALEVCKAYIETWGAS